MERTFSLASGVNIATHQYNNKNTPSSSDNSITDTFLQDSKQLIRSIQVAQDELNAGRFSIV